MKVEKKILKNLNKCYSIAPLKYKGKDHFLVAAEKIAECMLFDTEGNFKEKIWEEPGGVMSMVQVPNTDGQFLATHKFYSPNDSKEAKIIIATPKEGKWEIRTLVDLPHVHRFDILEKDGINYLIACTIKSGHSFKDDWTQGGKIYYAILPKDLSIFNQNNQLELKVLKEDLIKNHGYYKVEKGDEIYSIISAENGIFKCTPPKIEDEKWEIELLLEEAVSDAILIDLDEDGENELITLSPFHGKEISIFKKENNEYKKIYTCELETPFLHAICSAKIKGKTSIIIGNREGGKNLILFTYNKEKESYEYKIFDKNAGTANVMYYKKNEEDIIIATNREIDQIAMYTFR